MEGRDKGSIYAIDGIGILQPDTVKREAICAVASRFDIHAFNRVGIAYAGWASLEYHAGICDGRKRPVGVGLRRGHHRLQRATRSRG